MTSTSASGKEVAVSLGWYMFESLRNLGLGIIEMRRPYGSCISTTSNKDPAYSGLKPCINEGQK